MAVNMAVRVVANIVRATRTSTIVIPLAAQLTCTDRQKLFLYTVLINYDTLASDHYSVTSVLD